MQNQSSKTVAIIQSNYIPWKGYFDIIHQVDEFILYDDMQYTRRDWRNRNKIKTREGLKWLTIPVEVKGKYFQKIKDTIVSDPHWYEIHWKAIALNYARAPHFTEYRSFLEEIYRKPHSKYLSEINYSFLRTFCDLLGITTPIIWSSNFQLGEGKTERLINICQQARATRYISGPAARNYIDETLFPQAGIQLSFADYSGYPEYYQLYPPFEHGVSIIDLILNTGSQATRYLKSF